MRLTIKGHEYLLVPRRTIDGDVLGLGLWKLVPDGRGGELRGEQGRLLLESTCLVTAGGPLGAECSCPDFAKRGGPQGRHLCKHVRAVKALVGLFREWAEASLQGAPADEEADNKTPLRIFAG